VSATVAGHLNARPVA